MATIAKQMIVCHTRMTRGPKAHHHQQPTISQPSHGENKPAGRRSIISTLLATTAAVGLQSAPLALAEKWGTRSFIKERFFEPGLSPEDAAARIRQTAEGMRAMREMLDTMSWRYVIYYVRLKSAYLSSDLKNAMGTLPQTRRASYVKTANELVDNMAELDYYVRTPKIYESYIYYEKTLKSLDDLVALLA
ncbi:photosynthetic NDH subunit of lumenal location 2, chloroplastic [Magnolia sinica]|uniref:photosynthetic NDH subunit of lumenal location 2, chloroplastic n=1 Tax=Magnolia sinica TaxID=86752 RepID=UPI00265AA334|nr:photosynthetic NDH subunit of lumenal location 2, chloroplastic [Magnolia sinica]